MAAQSKMDALKENKNASFATTEKKFRYAIQSISEHIQKSSVTPEEALGWCAVQAALLVNLEKTREQHIAHKAFWKDHNDPDEAEA